MQASDADRRLQPRPTSTAAAASAAARLHVRRLARPTPASAAAAGLLRGAATAGGAALRESSLQPALPPAARAVAAAGRLR